MLCSNITFWRMTLFMLSTDIARYNVTWLRLQIRRIEAVSIEDFR